MRVPALILTAALLPASAAIAQAPQQSAAERALSAKLLSDGLRDFQASVTIISLQDQITTLQRQLADVRAKCGKAGEEAAPAKK